MRLAAAPDDRRAERSVASVVVPAALLWDFDGTIADTESLEYDAVRAVFAEHGADIPKEDWYAVVGSVVHIPPWLEQLRAVTGRPLDAADLMASRARHLEILSCELQPCVGVVELLEEATGAGVLMAVVSNSPHRWVTRHLQHLGLGGHFATVVALDDVTHGKPHPEPYATAARELGADPEQSVAIEDSEPGVASALAAGLVALGVPGPLSVNHDLSGADRVVESLAGLRLADLDELLRARQRTARRRPA